MVYNYKKYVNGLVSDGLQCPLKLSDTCKFENVNPTISVNVLVYENNDFPLYASKHRDRKHHVNLLMSSNNEGKFHYLLVRNLYAVVAVRTKSDGYTHVRPYCLYCFSEAPLLAAHAHSRIAPSTPSRRWSSPHPTIRRKI